MDREAIAVAGRLTGALAAFPTLACLARRVRQANCQNLLSSCQRTDDSINRFLQSSLASAEPAEVVVRVRGSHAGPDAADRLRFDDFHPMIPNLVESHLFQVERTADPLGKDCFPYPGTRAFWTNVEALFEPGIRKFVSTALEAAPVRGTQLSNPTGKGTEHPRDADGPRNGYKGGCTALPGSRTRAPGSSLKPRTSSVPSNHRGPASLDTRPCSATSRTVGS